MTDREPHRQFSPGGWLRTPEPDVSHLPAGLGVHICNINLRCDDCQTRGPSAPTFTENERILVTPQGDFDDPKQATTVLIRRIRADYHGRDGRKKNR